MAAKSEIVAYRTTNCPPATDHLVCEYDFGG